MRSCLVGWPAYPCVSHFTYPLRSNFFLEGKDLGLLASQGPCNDVRHTVRGGNQHRVRMADIMTLGHPAFGMSQQLHDGDIAIADNEFCRDAGECPAQIMPARIHEAGCVKDSGNRFIRIGAFVPVPARKEDRITVTTIGKKAMKKTGKTSESSILSREPFV